MLAQAVYAVMASTPGRQHQSAHNIKEAILMFYSDIQLFPAGVLPEMPCVQNWALKCGVALRRLVHAPASGLT